MDVKTKRIAKKVVKTSVWAVSDAVFLALKAIGTVLLIVATTGVVFACVFLLYLKSSMMDDLYIDPAEFSMSLSSVIYYVDPYTGRERELVTLQSTEYRRWVNYDEFPEHLINALVAIEDHRFFNHHGVDWFRTAGAFMNMFLSMQSTFGGSTITQQLIKNLTEEDDVTVQRKLLEIFRALEYENRYKKEEILELYLNFVYFGHGCYGIGAAAHYYFDKEVSELTLVECATIVGITNNPSQYSPYANREANTERRELILLRMHQLGYFETERDYRQALDSPVNFKRGEDEAYEQIIYTWFEETVIRDVIAALIKEKDWSEQVARRHVYTGGLRIISTIDLGMQRIVDSIYQDPEALPRVTGSSQQLQSGMIIADPYTGDIKALSGGVGSKTRNMLLNRATMTRRPPGSSIKPIAVYAPAMDAGLLTPETVFDDSAYVTLNGTTWMPKNADRSYSGIVTVRHAIIRSLNTIPAVVLDKFGPSNSFRFMRDVLGIGLSPADEDYAPLAAGQLTYGATVREMASAFTMFPNAGDRVELRSFTRIYDSNDVLLLDNEPKYTKAVSEWTAYFMTSMLNDAVTGGTGTAANLGRDMPTAGKTGTTTDSKDRWFVGFTPYYIAAVWTGYDTPAVMRSSGNPAAQIWKMVMAPIHENLERRDFSVPSGARPRPVAGSVEAVSYEIVCVDQFGNVVRRESVRAAPDREIRVAAPVIPGYTLTGNSVQVVTIKGSRTTVTFTYVGSEPEAPTTPEAPVTEDPGPSPSTTPGTTEPPVVTDSPSPTTPEPPPSTEPQTPDPPPSTEPSPTQPDIPPDQDSGG